MHPEYPAEGIPRRRLEERYGEGFHARVQQMIEQAGFLYNPPDVVPNSLPSLFLAELARDEGLFEPMHRSLFTAYWSEGHNIGDPEVLREIAAGAGIDISQFAEALQKGRYSRRIAESTEHAHRIGVSGVPAWLIANRVVVMGAQPHEAFETLLRQQGNLPNSAAV